MAQSKHQFYRKGADNQRTSDITIDLRRLDPVKIIKWTADEKKHLIEFMEMADASYQAFRKIILGVCK